jgi:hypothetical protein
MVACGYGPSLIKSDRPFLSGGMERSIALAAFSQEPFDARSACLAAVTLEAPNESLASQYRDFGAPTLFGLYSKEVFWFQHETSRTRLLERIEAQKLGNFFEQHREEFKPSRIYRAKTSAKFELSHQLSFVDAGLMPLLEQGSGEWLGRQVESLVKSVLGAVSEARQSQELSRWVFQSVFWLLAARLLRDKGVKEFKTLDVSDPEDVFNRVGMHYNATPPPLRTKAEREALQSAAKIAARFPSLANITTESLAYLHENTLVSQEVRRAFGTHSTPQWLVDYILWQLSPWIAEMDPKDRHVLEPACGHSPFLVGAVRLLGQFASSAFSTIERGKYLRQRVHGIEIDEFAREIGRLSLTLADVPNPNGWDLKLGNMFDGTTLVDKVRRAHIVLSNPPFEDFKDAKAARATGFKNKAAAMFAGVVEHLPPNGIFGVVMPQSILTSDNSEPIRERLTREYELREICLLPDGVFGKSAAESVVLIGQRRAPSGRHFVKYQRVRSWDLRTFKTELEPSFQAEYPQAGFLQSNDTSLRLPDLLEVWDQLQHHPRLGELFTAQTGFQFEGKAALNGRIVQSATRKAGWRKAFMRADGDYPIWEAPPVSWVDFSPEVIGRARAAAASGIAQIIVNYAGPQGPWCRKASVDNEGNAFSSRFVAMRPRGTSHVTLMALWAILNSPVANAYAYCYSTKWQTIPKEWLAFPLPLQDRDGIEEIHAAAEAYLEAADPTARGKYRLIDEGQVYARLLEMDATVLKAYSLPPDLEQQLLSIFDDIERPGVGCKFKSYPKVSGAVNMPFHLRMLVPRVHELTDLRLAGTIKPKQQAELDAINAKFDEFERTSPSALAFEAWMADLSRQRSKAMSKLDEIEASVRRKREEAGK